MLFFSFLPLKGLKSHSNLDSIINQKKRIQYELKELDRNFYIKSNNDNLIVIRDIEGDRNLNWEIRIYDRDLNLVNDTIFELDRSYIIQKIHSKKKNYEIIFKKNYSNEKEYLYLFYDTKSNKIQIEKINFPLSIRISNTLLFKESIVFFGNLKNGKSLIGIYNLSNRQLNNIYEYLYYDNDIINIYKNRDESFYVLISNRGKSGNKIIEKKSYNLKGEEIDYYAIESESHSIIESKIYSHNYKEIFLSLISNKNSNEAIGFQIDFLENGNFNYKKKIYFLEIKFISNFFKELKREIGRKVEKQEVNKIKLGYEFQIDTLFLLNEEIHFSVESIKPNFSNDGFSNYSYMPFYNTYSGTYDIKVNPKFGGFSHEISFYVKTDLKGNPISSAISDINNLNTFYKSPYKNYIVNNDSLIEFYVNKGIINVSKKKFNSISKVESSIKLQSNDNEVIIKSETNPEGTYRWYNNNYYSYGVQRLKKNKRVFFISNFEIK